MANATRIMGDRAGADMLPSARHGAHTTADEVRPWSWLKAIALDCRGSTSETQAGVRKAYASPVQKAAMSELSGTTGGYTVPVEYSALLLESVAEASFLRPRAFVQPMGSGVMILPRPVETGNAAGVSPFYGGISFGWGIQGAQPQDAVTAAAGPFGSLSLVPRDLVGLVTLSNQLLWDMGPEAEHQLIKLFGRAAAWNEEYAFLRGTGGADLMPLGILNSGALDVVTRSAHNIIAQADVADMAAALMPFSWTKAIWACNPSALVQIVKLTGFIPNQNMQQAEAGGAAGSLLCRPLFVTEKLPVLGTPGDLLLFDPSLYVIGDRQAVVIDASPHPAFRTNQTVFRVWLRVDGAPLLASTVTLADGGTTGAMAVALSAK